VPLLLLDLDNTLIDRAAAFRRWAISFTAAADAPAAEADWLIAEDRDGLEQRERLAAKIRYRFGLTDRQEAEILAELRRGLVEKIELDPAVPRALDELHKAGWVPVVVTNGTVHQQELKLTRTGLARHVAGWVISEGVGVRKPDPLIFQLAAEKVALELTGAWMIGDSVDADIGGAQSAGIRSIWLHRQRTWPSAQFAPTKTASTCVEALSVLLTIR
jgi:putative hydrolase of the HAD superfamily